MPASLTCEAPGCGEIKHGDDLAACIALMQLHQRNVHETSQRQPPPKINRPSVEQGIGEDEWAAFTRRWNMFRDCTQLTSSQINAQLLACCTPDLEAALFRDDPDIANRAVPDILKAIKRLAVLHVALSVRRTSLLKRKQEPGEPVRQYVARLRGLAHVCQWVKTTPCSVATCNGITTCNYTDEIVKLILISGLADEEIRKDVLGVPDIDGKNLSDVISLIDGKETAARAISDATCNMAVSSYKRAMRPNIIKRTTESTTEESDISTRRFQCACGRSTPQYGRVRGKMKKFETCIECWRKKRTDQQKTTQSRNDSVDARFHVNTNRRDKHRSDETSVWESLLMDKASINSNIHPFEATMPHPTLTVEAAVDQGAYARAKVSVPTGASSSVTVVADSGAQTCLMGLSVLHRLGLQRRHLLRNNRRILAANSKEIPVLGVVFLRLSGMSPLGQRIHAKAEVYVTTTTNRFYLSRTVLTRLGVIGHDFPKIGTASEKATNHIAVNNMAEEGRAECGCPRRTAPPVRPKHLPVLPSMTNAAEMKAWLLSHFQSSTFNTCPHQPLPTMTGPPMEIRVQPGTQPVVSRRPPHVPVHWRQTVPEQLRRDERLGVIERVPPNTPTTWLHNMVLTPKSDGTPRRTVDLQPLNRFCDRETHHTVPPAKQARAVPPNTVKTVTDAWNGYHAIPLRHEDRHKTTFITEEGRFRYCRAPMGFLASQDAYTQRYDAIIADVPRKTKCVDDTLLWDSDIEQHWWRVMDYLSLLGNNGVILNPSKFQFSSYEVDFAGFRITSNGLRPLPKYLDAIAKFPRPRNITDVRAWFGLVNQTSHYGRTTGLMEPFKPLLSSKHKFQWNATLDEAFERSKVAIVEEIRRGVEIFEPGRPTFLNCDWSKTGIGYWLRQKHCRCNSSVPECCSGGWRITLAGSRFLRDAEKRYAPIEGEALAVAWALEDSRFFTLGCRNLTVATDHKPLVKILGDKSMDAITNPRLFRIKQRTLMWRFKIMHVPGRSIPAADAASRYPSAEYDTPDIEDADALAVIRSPYDPLDDMEVSIVGAARSAAGNLGAVTWERVKAETAADTTLKNLISKIEDGFPNSRDCLPEDLQAYWQFRDRLCSIDGVAMLDRRVIIPQSLQKEVLRALHSAHQGTTKMQARASDTVFWPGITKDIEGQRTQCWDCWQMAPSQPRMPPATPTIPSRPFEAVAADFFSLRGIGYLVIVDRFSGWPHITASQSGSQGVINTLLAYFATFGVPEELSTDGGPEFTAKATESFLLRWGVRHRLSSAYHPQSNGRAEVAVKSMRRLLTSHTDFNGKADSEAVSAGILQYRNTPDADTGMSPSQIVFGTNLRDLLPVPPRTQVFSESRVHPVWRDVWQQRESALRRRFIRQVDNLRPNTRHLPPLAPGNRVLLQNQAGNNAKRWDRTGLIVEAKPHDQYLIKVDGSGRLTLRNRQYIRQFRDLPSGATADLSPPGSTTTAPDIKEPHEHQQQLGDESMTVREPTNVSDAIPPTRTPNETPISEESPASQPDQPTDPCELTPTAPTAEPPPPPSPIPPSPPRQRPQRNRRLPSRLQDYVLY